MYSLRPGKDAICSTEMKTATKPNYIRIPTFSVSHCLPSALRTWIKAFTLTP